MEQIRELLVTCWNSLQLITLWDVLDMAIIAFAIYKLLTTVSRTNSANVVKGICFVIILMWMSSFLHLPVVSYLLSQTFELGILALIVLFQPEIRRFLEQMGNSNFHGLFSRRYAHSEMDTAIAQTVLAYTDLSRDKTGALIVFERKNSLENYIKTGTIVDAAPTAELIKNIFFVNTPLHDGAVIVRGGRIASAACMLPLSNNPNLSRDLGMRHRAGVGMSENSDAVVAIVSEETGAISVAVDGVLKRHLTVETLDKLLRTELLPGEQPKKTFSFRKNGGPKEGAKQ